MKLLFNRSIVINSLNRFVKTYFKSNAIGFAFFSFGSAFDNVFTK
jgi:hypothetical protein